MHNIKDLRNKLAIYKKKLLDRKIEFDEVLFEKLQLPSGKKNKSGGFQTGADVLETVALEGFDIASHFREWSKISKLHSPLSGESSRPSWDLCES